MEIKNSTSDFRVICLESEAFYALIRAVTNRLKAEQKIEEPPRWITGKEVMQMLNVSSRTTLQKLRDSGMITYTQPSKKIILYDRKSILEYLQHHAKHTF